MKFSYKAVVTLFSAICISQHSVSYPSNFYYQSLVPEITSENDPTPDKTTLSILGDDARLYEDMIKECGTSPTDATIGGTAYSAYSAIDRIVDAVADKRVVVLNEAHHISQHRLFALDLAIALRRLGFTHISLEAAQANALDAFNTSGQPDSSLGYYILDPEFSYFLRQAHRAGYQFYGHEQWRNDGQYGNVYDAREAGQANAVKRLLDQNPSYKVFVYGGYAHVREETYTVKKPLSAEEAAHSEKIDPGSSTKTDWMAKRVKDLLGEEILTIDQVGGTCELIGQEFWSDFGAIPATLDAPSLILDESNTPIVSSQYKGAVDFTVVHPLTATENLRPSWLSGQEDRTEIRIPIKDLNISYPVILQAYLATEQSDAIPVDQVFITEKRDTVHLHLPQGTYVITAEVQGDKRLFLQEIMVGE